MTATATRSASYADVLHRLSLGESVWGGELRKLPGVPWRRPRVADRRYQIHELPELVTFVLAMAALLNDEDGEYVLLEACEINDHLASNVLRGKPIPEHLRGLLWDIATRVDLANNLAGMN